MEPATYPVQFSVDYSDRLLNRLTTCFRVFMVILVHDLKVPSKMEFWPSRRQTESPLSRSKAVSNESVGTPRMSGKN